MPKTPHPFTVSADGIPAAELRRHARGWLLDAELRQLSEYTLAKYRHTLQQLLAFLDSEELPACDSGAVCAFLVSLARRKLSSGTQQTRYRTLHALFEWLVAEDLLGSSPKARLRPPVHRDDQIQPLTAPHCAALIAAAKRSRQAHRNTAIVWVLLDTGARASELCALRRSDLDFDGRHLTVEGKGSKRRSLYFGRQAARALWAYLARPRPEHPDRFLFMGERGRDAEERFTRSGLRRLIALLGTAAGIADCHPHQLRHTFAVEFLRNGGNVFTLQQFLGHTSLAMVRRYVALAEADLEAQHRQFSPGDSVARKR